MSFSAGYLLNIGKAYFAGRLLRPASSDGCEIRQTAQSTVKLPQRHVNSKLVLTQDDVDIIARVKHGA